MAKDMRFQEVVLSGIFFLVQFEIKSHRIWNTLSKSTSPKSKII